MMINLRTTPAQVAAFAAVGVAATLCVAVLAISRRSDDLSSRYAVIEGAPRATSTVLGAPTAPGGRLSAVDHLVGTASAPANPPSCLDEISGSAPIRNCGEVTIAAGHSINLDSQAANWDADSPGSDNVTFYGSNLDNSLPGKGLVDETSTVSLTYAICAATPAADFHGSIDLTTAKKGTTFCARTPLDHYAVVRLLADWAPNQVRLLVTTWQPTD
jgi:hypothetical protein